MRADLYPFIAVILLTSQNSKYRDIYYSIFTLYSSFVVSYLRMLGPNFTLFYDHFKYTDQLNEPTNLRRRNDNTKHSSVSKI